MSASSHPLLKIDHEVTNLRAIACHAPAAVIAVGENKSLPTRMCVMPWGENATAKGRVIVNGTTLSTLPGVMKRSNLDRIALDFEHNTVPGQPSYKGEPAKIAAMGTPEIVEGQGLFLSNIEWTADGHEHVGGGHYPDLSPVVVVNAHDEVLAFSSVGACRAGATPGLSIPLSAVLNLPAPSSKMDYKKLVCSILGCAEDAPESEIENAAAAFTDKTKALNTDTATVIKTLSTRLEDVEKRENERERTMILSLAAHEGKVVPKAFTEGDTALDNVKLRALVAELPVSVPLDRRTPMENKAPDAIALSAAEDTVRVQLGISKEDWEKFNKAA